MKWIILHCPDGMYVISPRLSVRCRVFARRFNSVRLAENYISKIGLDRNNCRIEEFTDDDDSNRSFYDRIKLLK